MMRWIQQTYQFLNLKGEDIPDGVQFMDNLFKPQFIG